MGVFTCFWFLLQFYLSAAVCKSIGYNAVMIAGFIDKWKIFSQLYENSEMTKPITVLCMAAKAQQRKKHKSLFLSLLSNSHKRLVSFSFIFRSTEAKSSDITCALWSLWMHQSLSVSCLTHRTHRTPKFYDMGQTCQGGKTMSSLLL